MSFMLWCTKSRSKVKISTHATLMTGRSLGTFNGKQLWPLTRSHERTSSKGTTRLKEYSPLSDNNPHIPRCKQNDRSFVSTFVTPYFITRLAEMSATRAVVPFSFYVHNAACTLKVSSSDAHSSSDALAISSSRIQPRRAATASRRHPRYECKTIKGPLYRGLFNRMNSNQKNLIMILWATLAAKQSSKS